VLVDTEVALLLLLVVLGASKFASTARDLGLLLRSGTERTVEEAKYGLIPDEVKEARDVIKDLKTEALYGAEQDKRRHKP
jgi:Sec-independent protein translocase protein TatA